MKAFLKREASPRERAQLVREAEAVNMEKRQDIHDAIIRGKSPTGSQGKHRRSHVGLRVHHALRPAGRARTVDHQTGSVSARVALGNKTTWRLQDRGVRDYGLEFRQLRSQCPHNRPLLSADNRPTPPTSRPQKPPPTP